MLVSVRKHDCHDILSNHYHGYLLNYIWNRQTGIPPRHNSFLTNRQTMSSCSVTGPKQKKQRMKINTNFLGQVRFGRISLFAVFTRQRDSMHNDVFHGMLTTGSAIVLLCKNDIFIFWEGILKLFFFAVVSGVGSCTSLVWRLLMSRSACVRKAPCLGSLIYSVV